MVILTYSVEYETVGTTSTKLLEPGTAGGLSEALLSLLPVDNRPDGLEVL